MDHTKREHELESDLIGLKGLVLTFFVIVAYYGVLEDVWEREVDGVFLAMVAAWFVAALLLQCALPLIIRPQLVTPHAPHQPLPLTQRQRLQQTLVYLHVLPEDVT